VGQQQLLFIVLIIVVVGIAVVVASQMFGENIANANLQAVTNDLMNLSSEARRYFLKPALFGGGDGSFVGLTADAEGMAKISTRSTNDNGIYSIITAGNATSVTLQGIGKEDGDGDGSNCIVQVTVFADDLATNIINR